MILRKIEVKNFRQLYGTNEISFAPPGDANVTVILGTNGGGKTTLLNSFLWCLYGEIDLQNPDEIISHKAVQEAPVGAELEAAVRLIFEAEGLVHHASRTLRAKKKEGGRLELLNDRPLEVMTMDHRGRSAPAGDPIALVERLLPRPLSKFFFFRGEDMEQLALPGSGEKLKTGTETFLDFTVLDRSVNHLRQVGDDLEKEIREIARGDARDISEQMEKLKGEIEDLRARRNNAIDEANAVSDQREMIERELAAIDETRPLLEEKARLLERQKGLDTSEDRLRARVASLVSEHGYLIFSPNVLEEPLRLAEQAVEKGELPAKIKPKFVDDLLEKGVCICNHPIDSYAATALRAYRAQTGLAALEEEILSLRGEVTRLSDRREAFKRDLATARQEYATAQQELHDTSLAISRIQSELQGKDFGLDEIKDTQAKLRALSDKLVEAKVRVGQLENQIDGHESRYDELEKERAQKLGDSAKEQALTARKDAVKGAAQAIGKLRDGWANIVQSYLDAKLKDTWGRIAQLERLVAFTPDFHLSIKERGGDGSWITSAPSQANQRALALSFIGALIALSREVAETPTQGTASVFAGGDCSLVMDAPFATMDTYFKTKIPTGLVGLIPQIVLISSYDQWEGEVAGALEKRVGKRYVLELHKPGRESEDRTVQLAGRSVDYEVSENAASTDWSIVREVV